MSAGRQKDFDSLFENRDVPLTPKEQALADFIDEKIAHYRHEAGNIRYDPYRLNMCFEIIDLLNDIYDKLKAGR